MSGGIPKVSKGSNPCTPMTPGMLGGFGFPKVEARPDPAQEIIRNRQKEAEDQKRRLLAAYDYISKTGAGPKTVVMEELRRVESEFHFFVPPSEILEPEILLCRSLARSSSFIPVLYGIIIVFLLPLCF